MFRVSRPRRTLARIALAGVRQMKGLGSLFEWLAQGDRVAEVLDAHEAAAAWPTLGEFAEPAFGEVQPGAGGSGCSEGASASGGAARASW